MIGPDGQRDYVEMLLDDGCPVICGPDPAYAGHFPPICARNAAQMIRRHWLPPHIAIEFETAP